MVNRTILPVPALSLTAVKIDVTALILSHFLSGNNNPAQWLLHGGLCCVIPQVKNGV